MRSRIIPVAGPMSCLRKSINNGLLNSVPKNFLKLKSVKRLMYLSVRVLMVKTFLRRAKGDGGRIYELGGCLLSMKKI